MHTGGLLLLARLLIFWAELSLISSQPDICYLPKVAGKCEAYMPCYYFNTKTQKCEKFIYGGCGGNANRFKTLKECHYTCVEKPGSCPNKAPPDLMTICLVKCDNDWSCLGAAKCCNFGCLRDCVGGDV